VVVVDTLSSMSLKQLAVLVVVVMGQLGQPQVVLELQILAAAVAVVLLMVAQVK
jgi:hypothetical protein